MILCKEYNERGNGKLMTTLERIIKDKTYCVFTYENAHDIIKNYANMAINLRYTTDNVNEKDMSFEEAKSNYDIVIILELDLNAEEISLTLSKETDNVYKLAYCFTKEVEKAQVYNKIANDDYIIKFEPNDISEQEINDLLNKGRW